MKEHFYKHDDFIYKINLPRKIQKKIDNMADMYLDILGEVSDILYDEEDEGDSIDFAMEVIWEKLRQSINDEFDSMED